MKVFNTIIYFRHSELVYIYFTAMRSVEKSEIEHEDCVFSVFGSCGEFDSVQRPVFSR